MRNGTQHNAGNPMMPLLFLSVTLCFFGLESVFAGDWPCWRGPEHNGIMDETDWEAQWSADGPRQLWSKEIGTGFSSITVCQGKVYTMGNGGGFFRKDKDTVYCFDARTGKEIWAHDYDQPLDPKWYEGGPSATPTIDGEFVYTFSKKGDLFCLNKDTGAVRWHKQVKDEFGIKPPNWGFAGSVLIHGDRLILNAGKAGLAVRKDNGVKIWQNGDIEAGYATPVPYTLNGRELVIIFGKKAVYGVAVQDGAIVWQHPWETAHDENIADPVVCPKTNDVFVSSAFGVGGARFAIDESGNVTKKWHTKKMRNHMATSVLWKGYLYGFDESSLTCIDFASGEEKWSQGGYGKGTLIITTDGRMLILSEKGELISAKADPEQFEPISQARILPSPKRCWTVPTLVEGLLYARNSKGEMVCVELKYTQ